MGFFNMFTMHIELDLLDAYSSTIKSHQCHWSHKEIDSFDHVSYFRHIILILKNVYKKYNANVYKQNQDKQNIEICKGQHFVKLQHYVIAHY